MEPTFLDLADVIVIHSEEIELRGGQHGIRDLGLLHSALAMPRARFGGEWLHRDLFEMAAAYAFHISQDHPFLDGHKRMGLACALVFLDLNGAYRPDPEGKLRQAMFHVGSGLLDKYGLADVFRSLSA